MAKPRAVNTTSVYIRLTPEQLQIIKENAAACNMSMSEYMRNICTMPIKFSYEKEIDRRTGRPYAIIVYPSILRSISDQLLSLANDFNQAVRVLNILSSKKDRDIKRIVDAKMTDVVESWNRSSEYLQECIIGLNKLIDAAPKLSKGETAFMIGFNGGLEKYMKKDEEE